MRRQVATRDPSKQWVCEALMRIRLDPRLPYLVAEVMRRMSLVETRGR